MTKSLSIDVAGRLLPIALKRSSMARRMSLRVDPTVGGVVMVLPVGVSVAEAERFAARQRAWIAERLAALPERQVFAPGAAVPILGVPHPIRHAPTARRGVWTEDGALMVSGLVEHMGRRVADFLVAEARRQVVPRAHGLAERIGRKITRISLRDTRSRWGSCTADGALAFSWRLVMAPEWVLSYVVAHEVAHLAELNHGPRFWQVVAELGGEPRAARSWLKAHGPGLHRWG
ncbi:MAG: M48 family metallopeptidase [Actinomycetota bacterium]